MSARFMTLRVLHQPILDSMRHPRSSPESSQSPAARAADHDHDDSATEQSD